MKKIWIGTCGQVVSWQRFFDLFTALELNSTFYKFPTERQLKNWKKYLEAGKQKGAFLSLKAHQLFTHPLKSPTWKRSEFGPEERKKLKDLVGCLKWNDFTVEQLERLKTLVEELKQDLVLFQLPAACEAEKEQILPFLLRAKETLKTKVGLEIRWNDLSLLKKVAEEGVTPVFDPFLEPELRENLFPELDFLYLRLHGKKDSRGKINYRYQYTDSDFRNLKTWLEGARAPKICVLFNNVYMKEDALRFKEFIY